MNRTDPLQVSDPIEWDHHTEEGAYLEEGHNNMTLAGGPPKQQKFMGKKTFKKDYAYFDYSTDMGADEFMASVSREEKDRWYPDLKKELKKARECGGEKWYFVFSGPGCGLYKNYKPFIEARDADMPNGGPSLKGTCFNSLEEAKAWIQASRDEEGAHWGWPETMPIWF